MICNVKINQICIALAYSRDTISKKMHILNVKLIIEARFKFCYVIGLKDLLSFLFKINQICIALAYSRDIISKKMRILNVKLIIEARFEFCYVIGLKDLLPFLLMRCRCNYLPVNCMTRVF